MRIASRVLAGLTAVAVSTCSLQVASAQEMLTGTTISYPAPTATPTDVILGVGATESDANLNWITSTGIAGQSVQFAPAGTPIAEGTTVAATSTNVDINTTENYKDRAPVNSYPVASHKAVLSGLKENTEYTYRVGSDKDGWSKEYTFNSGTFGNEWGFTFVGDPQLYITKLDKNLAGWTSSIAKATADGKSSFILSAGDQSNYSNYQEHSAWISAPELKKYRTGVNMGNHEMVDADAYYAMYNRPNVEDENYYFEYNNALIVSLDSNDWEDVKDDIDWLKKTVAEKGADKDWVILTYHHSSFSQAYHMEDTHIKYWRDNMVPAISEAGVDLVLGGHDHIYTRSHLMNGYQPVDHNHVAKVGETIEKKDGQVQYVAMNSSSGSKFYDFYDYKYQSDEATEGKTQAQSEADMTIRDYTAIWDQNYQPDFMNLTITPEKLSVKVTDAVDGALVDEFHLTHAADAAAPAPGLPGSSDKGDKADKGSSTTAGIIAAIVAILAAVGGAGFAAMNGMIPGFDAKAIAAQFGVKF